MDFLFLGFATGYLRRPIASRISLPRGRGRGSGEGGGCPKDPNIGRFVPVPAAQCTTSTKFTRLHAPRRGGRRGLVGVEWKGRERERRESVREGKGKERCCDEVPYLSGKFLCSPGDRRRHTNPASAHTVVLVVNTLDIGKRGDWRDAKKRRIEVTPGGSPYGSRTLPRV
jgi:hypothetical protein